MYYITYVFQMAGQTGSVLLLSSSIQYIINVVMTVPALLFMDRWGRRPTMLIGAALMASFMFINGGLVSSGVHHPGGFFGTREVTYTLSGSRATALIGKRFPLLPIKVRLSREITKPLEIGGRLWPPFYLTYFDTNM